MSKDRFDVLERFSPLFEAPEPSFERFLRRRERKLRNQRIAAGVVAIALFVAPIAIFAGLISFDRTQTPGATGPSVTGPGVPEVDYVIDLNTGVMTPLPRAILRSLGETAEGQNPESQYAVSPDGSRLAYVGSGDDGTLQIFVSGIDGSGVRQVTHHPTGAISPAWSPDGTKIAYVGNSRSFDGNLFVLDVGTGEATKITDETGVEGPQFTPDGSSLLYTVHSIEAGVEAAELRTVPVSGGRSTLLFDPQARGFGGAGGGSLSPDGSLVTFMGDRIGGPGALRFVANADGTDWRIVGSCISNPAGTWSPDGTRIVCGPNGPPPGIRVIDVPTGDATRVAEGRVAIWLDDHTLLVEV